MIDAIGNAHRGGKIGNTGRGKIARPSRPRLSRRPALVALTGLAALALTASACGSSPSASGSKSGSGSGPAKGSTAASTGKGVTVHLGYFPNITHAPALVGVQEGIFRKALGPDKLATPSVFSAGPAENQALLSGSVDIAFEGPSSALSAYSSSKAVTIVSGAAGGGAGLVVDKSITSPKQLKGTKLGSPQLANTQDVALRYWLKTQGYTTTANGGGAVHVLPSSTGSGTIVEEFKSHDIQGAWMPEPYEQELIAAGGHVLVNEASLWPHGKWATTNVVVKTSFLKAHPATVSRFLQGLVQTLTFMRTHKSAAETAANQQLAKLQGGKSLPPSVLKAAWNQITFTDDPLASTLQEQVKHGEAVGLLKNPGNLKPIYDLKPLDALLAKEGKPRVKGL